MGLTNQSTGIKALNEVFKVEKKSEDDVVIALAGNPNTGKSTVFNSLTGLNQHTGNWPGKTVTNAQGYYKFKDKNFILVDLPGTYSLLSSSVEEEVARDFICFSNPQATVVVTDATCLERNLNLVLQITEMTDKVVVCVNLMDEAKRKGIEIDLDKLTELTGVPFVGTAAREGKGLDVLMDKVYKVSSGETKNSPKMVSYEDEIEKEILLIEEKLKKLIDEKINYRWLALKIIDGDEKILEDIENYLGVELIKNIEVSINRENIQDRIVGSIVKRAEEIVKASIKFTNKSYNKFDRKIDNVLTSKAFGIPIMIALLAVVFWITLEGANIPSEIIAKFLFGIEDKLTNFFITNNLPNWLHGALILGVYRTLAWVVSVMLPPMAIFFPLFTLLEDLGYLPRVAFNLDNYFKNACCHGKQCLTMCMGFGCNAAGVIGCRIIDSKRERLIAIITNFFVPCNGRFPTLLTITSIFIAGTFGGFSKTIVSTLTITAIIILGIIITLIVSKILSKTILKGIPSSFSLELPPFRKPQVGKIIVRSIFDRTIFVLGRAVMVAAPAGLVIWLFANISLGNMSILDHCAGFLQPFAKLIGLDGYILMAFILGLPANEIVMPIIIMSYMATGKMIELENLDTLRKLLVDNGWTMLTAVNVMLFSLLHFPCATTLLTIKKETQSVKWTVVSFLVPTIVGLIVCFSVTQLVHLVTVFL